MIWKEKHKEEKVSHSLPKFYSPPLPVVTTANTTRVSFQMFACILEVGIQKLRESLCLLVSPCINRIL